MDFKTFYEMFFSLLIGLLIGIERERAGKGEALGSVRTFTLVSFFGFLSMYLTNYLPFSFYISLIGILFLSIASYIYFKASTTAVSFVITFILGGLTEVNLDLALISSVIFLLILSFKAQLHKIVKGIKETEWLDTIKFLILAFIVFPILPEKPIDPWGVINLKEIWKIVIMISLLNFVGYIALKIFGKKGMVFSGIFGGLASSTAVTLSVSSLARRKNIENLGASTIIAAISTMFLRIPVVSSFVSINISLSILPYAIFSSAIGFLYSYLIYKRSKGENAGEILEMDSPFNIEDALKFGLLFGAILVLVNLGEKFYGNIGILFVSALSGITDVDAINLSLSSMYEIGKILKFLAIFGIFLATTVNNIVKGMISFLSNKKMGFLTFLGIFLMSIPFFLMVVLNAP